MQVYIEFALLENFCMDFCLLYGAKVITKNITSYKRLILGSVLGAVFAVVLPLIYINPALNLLLKIISGKLICVVGARCKPFKKLIKFTATFFILTFVLGGVLIAFFTFFQIEYLESGTFIISSIPLGIPLFFALVLILFCKFLFKNVNNKNIKNAVKCSIVRGQLSVKVNGFYDSGNKVYYKGLPVSIIDLSIAIKIIDVSCINDYVLIHTVAGSKKIKIFTADEIILYIDNGLHKIKNVAIGISPTPITTAVFHPDLAEVI